MTIEFRTITDAEIPAYREAMLTTFGEDAQADEGGADRTRALCDPSRLWAAFDGATIVGSAATYDFDLVVPGGGRLAMAGLTMVMVRPSHRRRGVLRQLIELHLDDAARRGVAISGLWASEASIYGRFGYGVAVESDAIEIKDAGRIDAGRGRELDALEWLDEARAREVLPAIYERAIAHRPGALIRSALWWRERRFSEVPLMRGSASRRRHVAARRGGELVGYLSYRQRPGFTDGLPSGKLDIIELIATDPLAEATLWQFACHVDLFPTVAWWNAPADDVLVWSVADPRRIMRRRADTLWLRIADVPAALTARTYASDGALCIAVDDAAWELAVEGGAPRCTPAARAPELRLSRATLGALYLGGVPASRLARAGLVHGGAAALAAADRLFAWPVAPWCPEVF
jgi:predicted acetyltransferase